MSERRTGEQLRDAARRVAIDAVYHARESGGTMHTAGEQAAAAVLALLEPVDGHLVDLGEGTFTVTHPLTERADGTMHTCGLHTWLHRQDGPPVPPGRYRATEQDDPVSPWLFERIGDVR